MKRTHEYEGSDVYGRQAGDWHRDSTPVEMIDTVAKPRIGIEGYMTGRTQQIR